MLSGEHLPADQAELVWHDPAVEYLGALTEAERLDVLAEVETLFKKPWGKHPLSNRNARDQLASLNTLTVLGGQHRVVFRAATVTVDGAQTGVIDILCAGERKGDVIYDVANALVRSGILDADDVTQCWDVLALLDILPEQIGADGWDFQPEPASEGQIKQAVAAGTLDEGTARVLSQRELLAAADGAWTAPSPPDKAAALDAALHAARSGVHFDSANGIILGRREPRCGSWMPRAHAPCIRRNGHPGAHRSTP